jgi:hypothetical protein
VLLCTQVAATLHTRFFFPAAEGNELGGGNAFYRHLDVTELPPLPKSFPAACALVDDGAPAWVEDAWSRLYYQHVLRRDGSQGTIAPTMTTGPPWPEVRFASKPLSADASGQDDAQRLEFEDFCQLVARLRPRTQADVEPLNALRNGLFKMVVEQLCRANDILSEKLRHRELRLRDELGGSLRSLAGQLHELRGSADREIARVRLQYDADKAEVLSGKSLLGDAKSSQGDAKSSLGDAKSSLGDAKSSLGE